MHYSLNFYTSWSESLSDFFCVVASLDSVPHSRIGVRYTMVEFLYDPQLMNIKGISFTFHHFEIQLT